jgi:hypothetical protein
MPVPTAPTARPALLRRAAVLGLTGAAAVGLVGCGPDLETPEGVVEAFADAMAERDWEGACGLLSHDYVHRTTDGNSRYCALYLERRHEDVSGWDGLEVQGEPVRTEQGWEVVVAPADDPGRGERAVVVEESGRLVLLGYPGGEPLDP